MKKVFLMVLILLFFVTGCTKYSEADIIKDLDKKVNKTDAYLLEGDLEIVNNDEVYDYEIEVSYKKDTFYKVKLTNVSNDHTQIILKNKDGVYVLTPSLNKSFKFQSDWPYSNSQIYLLSALINDIGSDKERKFEELDDGYMFKTKVNYPNNRNLVNQEIELDKNLNFKTVKVYNSDGAICMTMEFNKIDFSPKFSKDYFDLDNVMSTYSVDMEETVETSSLDDSIYPLVLPRH